MPHSVRRSFKSFRLFSGVAGIATAAFMGLSAAQAQALSNVEDLVPHRAVYNLKLHDASDRSGIAAVDGRIVYDISGSRCEGYTSTFRLVMRAFDTKGGSQLTDLKTSSHEGGNGFDFTVRTFANGVQTEDTLGHARHDDTGIVVDLKRSDEETLSFEGDALLPVEHTKAIIAAAQAGRHILQADTFDGSESGRAVFPTLTVIGKPVDKTDGNEASANAAVRGEDHADVVAKIGKERAWPVTVSYYDSSTQMTESAPIYEISFLLYANGITRRLLLDYGDFSIDGGLSDIEFYKPAAPCPAN
ncbi:cell envelope integrity EipB family protein [Breoghania sp.]|uniref:cell envelope integrity EipB family protein n=1 Tax=Breoghania sp. TaxID=2065378 RepID=UPI00261A4B90|nr:cell envelope integrity EipB family protein [Breoghania sp.]MDJ0929889.1 cell envelope integrity EipB family protein [Breoghania sp.]